MRSSTPARSAATSTLTFPVSSWTGGSPAEPCSPSRFSQAPTVASTTDSPSWGTRTSTGMDRLPRQRRLDDAPLLDRVDVRPALGWTGALRSADVAQRPLRTEQLAQPRRDEAPAAHVARLFLQPD